MSFSAVRCDKIALGAPLLVLELQSLTTPNSEHGAVTAVHGSRNNSLAYPLKIIDRV
jgi:hypothetical protein